MPHRRALFASVLTITANLLLTPIAGAQTAPAALSPTEARKELASLGIQWNPDSFRRAVVNKDYHGVELFLQSGMDSHNDPAFRGAGALTFLTFFIFPSTVSTTRNNFDPKIATMLMTQYPGFIDPARDCPPIAFREGSTNDDTYLTYMRARDNEDINTFLKFFCNKPPVIAKIDARIAELKTLKIGRDVKSWREAKSALTGLPPDIDQPKTADEQAPSQPHPSNPAPAPVSLSNPSLADIAGVRLGMTPDEAAAALEQFNSRFVIKKLYSQTQYGLGLGGGDLTAFSDAERAKYFLTGLSAVDEGEIKPETRCSNPLQSTSCVTTVRDDVETITVGFSPVSGKERVIGITREKTFTKEPKPAIATLIAGVLTKYPDRPTYQHPVSGGSTVGWQFDARRQLMSAATAKSKLVIEVFGQLPHTVSPGDGITLSARAVSADVGFVPNIAGNFYMSLVDSDALYKAGEQSKSAAAAVRAKVDAATIEKAKGASATKF